MRLPGGLLLALLLGACLGAGADESRAYHGLWGGLFRHQEAARSSSSTQPAGDAVRQALADLQARLFHPPTAAAANSSEAVSGPARHSTLDDFLSVYLDWTASLLDHGSADVASGGALARSSAGNATASSSPSLLQRVHDHVAADLAKLEPQQLATLAAVQAWALGTLLASGAGSGAASGSASNPLSSAGSSLRSSSSSSVAAGSASPTQAAAQHVGDPASAAFRGHTCLRLQNFGNAEGYYAALLGPSPCIAPPGGGSAAAAAARGEALRWGSRASFLLDCSRGGGASAGAGSSGLGAAGSSAGSSSTLSSMLHAAASKVAAALDRTAACRLAVTTDSGSDSPAAGGSYTASSSGSGGGAAVADASGVLLEHVFGWPLLGAPKLDALRIRVCNMPPTAMQYPAALARSAAISLHSLKLNGRPLLPAALQASQAGAAADGCLVHLLRIPAKATKSGFVLTGWVRLDEAGSSGGGSSGGGGGGAGASGSGGLAMLGGEFGVGEMASVEVQLGEYSLLDAAASRLLGTLGGAGAAGGEGLQA